MSKQLSHTISNKGLTLFSLIMLITGAIDSIRNLPTTALFGTTLIFFFIFAAIMFLIPAGLVSAELASTWTEKGGIYQWMKLAFGEKTAFFTIWLQWINTLVWYPTMLSFIAGTVAYLINPDLAHNKIYLVSMILSTFWVLTFVNLRGLKTSAKFASFCAVVGMITPMLLMIGFFLIWVLLGKPLQIHFTTHNVLPSLQHGESWISLTAIMTAFLGMELATVHVNHVDKPQKTFPKALFYSIAIILTTMVLGSLAIAFVLPKSQINLVDGIMQAFTSYFKAFHMSGLIPVITIMLVIGSLGSMINWIISPAKGLLHAAEDNFLPHFLQKKNSHGVAQNLLLLQAIVVTFVCLAFLLMPTVNGSYWLLTDLSTELYMLMYLFMFVAVIYLRYKFKKIARPFKIPGGNWGVWLVGLFGIFGTLITLTVGFIPPGSINVGGFSHYEIMFVSGVIAMLLPVVIFYIYQWRFSKAILARRLG